MLSQLQESESQVNGFARVKQSLNSQIEEARRAAEDENRARSSLNQQLRNLNGDFATIKCELEEEQARKNELQKLMSKANVECAQWRSKYETEGIVRAEELEDAKRKLASKLAEAEEQVEQALVKCSSLEKTKHRLQNDVEDLMVDVEKAHANSSGLEKKQKQFDRLIAEWKSKCETITSELDQSQKEARQYSAEVFKLKSQYQESQDTIDGVRHENKNLAEEIRDLYEQLTSGGKCTHELEKSKKRMEGEKEELQSALESAEMHLEQSEAKVSLAVIELTNARQETERRILEKEEEFQNTRNNHARALESINVSLNSEIKNKNDAIRQKKKLESEINELEISLDHTRRNHAEAQSAIKKLNQTISEQQVNIEDEQRQKGEIREQLEITGRQCNTLSSEINELQCAITQGERSRKAVENDLHEAAERLAEYGSVNLSLAAQKRKADNDLASIQTDLDEAMSSLKQSDERTRKASAETARLAEELAQEKVLFFTKIIFINISIYKYSLNK